MIRGWPEPPTLRGRWLGSTRIAPGGHVAPTECCLFTWRNKALPVMLPAAGALGVLIPVGCLERAPVVPPDQTAQASHDHSPLPSMIALRDQRRLHDDAPGVPVPGASRIGEPRRHAPRRVAPTP